MEVAVDEHRAPGAQLGEELPRARDQLAARARGALGLVEPGADVIADPPKRLPGRSPEPPSDVDGDRRRPRLGQVGEVIARNGALEQQGAALVVAAQQAHGAVAVPRA